MATIMDRENEAAFEAGRKAGATSVKPTSAKPPSPPKPFTSRIGGAMRTSSSSPVAPGVTLPMVLDVAIITADELTNQHRLPLPSRLLAAFVLFGFLGALKGEAARPAKVFAWAIVIATFYGNSPGQKPAALSALESLGGFLGGQYGTSNASPGGNPPATTNG